MSVMVEGHDEALVLAQAEAIAAAVGHAARVSQEYCRPASADFSVCHRLFIISGYSCALSDRSPQ
jgi:hypothetical protein